MGMWGVWGCEMGMWVCEGEGCEMGMRDEKVRDVRWGCGGWGV